MATSTIIEKSSNRVSTSIHEISSDIVGLCNDMSLSTICHCQRYVTVNDMSLSTICHSQRYVTLNDMSLSTFCRRISPSSGLSATTRNETPVYHCEQYQHGSGRVPILEGDLKMEAEFSSEMLVNPPFSTA